MTPLVAVMLVIAQPVAGKPPPREKPFPTLLVVGLSVLGIGIAGQTVDVLLSEAGHPNAQGLLMLGAVPVVGSALFGFASLRTPPLSAFGARAFVWMGVQAVGVALAVLWGFLDDPPPAPVLSPVPGGAVVGFSHRF